MSVSSSNASSVDTLGLHSFTVPTKKGLTLSCSTGTAFLPSSSSLSKEVMEESFSCSLPENTCRTEGGPDYPAACAETFINDGRQFYACTDVNSPLENKTWCATEVDSKNVMVPGKWGYCTPKCGYCGGSPVNVTRQAKRSCGYDCLINPNKVEVITRRIRIMGINCILLVSSAILPFSVNAL